MNQPCGRKHALDVGDTNDAVAHSGRAGGALAARAWTCSVGGSAPRVARARPRPPHVSPFASRKGEGRPVTQSDGVERPEVWCK